MKGRSAHAPVNGGPVFPGTFLGHFWFFVFYFIKISKFALPGVMLTVKIERKKVMQRVIIIIFK